MRAGLGRKGNLGSLVAGIVSGASANDPTTVASLAVIGSTTGYGLAWLVLLAIPMLAVVQLISAHVGGIRHLGFAKLIRLRFGLRWTLLACAAVVIVNVVTLAADLEGGAAAISLMSDIDYRWVLLPLAAVATYLLISRRWILIERWLQFMPLLFLAYIGSALLARPDWHDVLRHTFLPSFGTSRAYVEGAIALLGTTLTGYVYIWHIHAVAESRPERSRITVVRAVSTIGIVASGVVFWFIVIGTGATLGADHISVATAADAARALTPLAGPWSSALFGVALLGSALASIPIIAATTAHVAADTFGKPGSLNESLRSAPWLYGALTATMLVSTLVAYCGIPPIRLLFFASIAGGIATPVTLVFLVMLASDRGMMDGCAIDRKVACAGWCVIAVLVLAVLAYVLDVLIH
jgi:Mn2+/Fe2+ NRAMP family transporter